MLHVAAVLEIKTQFVEVFSGLCASPDTGHYSNMTFIKAVDKSERWSTPYSSLLRNLDHESSQRPLQPSFLSPACWSDGCPVPWPWSNPKSLPGAAVTTPISSDRPQQTEHLTVEIQLTMLHKHHPFDRCSQHSNSFISCPHDIFLKIYYLFIFGCVGS